MIILGIETSCDETAISILECSSDPRPTEQSFGQARKSASSPSAFIRVLGNVLYSQVKIHEQYGGVFPMLAKREHSKNLIPLLKKAMESSSLISNFKFQISNEKEEKIKKILEREEELLEQFLEFIPTIEKPPIDAIAVTYGPGLEPALWVGISFAKALSEVWNIPIVPVNHMEGHLIVALLRNEMSNNKFSRFLNTKIEDPRFCKAKSGQISNEKTGTKDKVGEFVIENVEFPLLALLVSGGHTELVLAKNWGEYEILGQTKDDAVGEAFDKVARILGLPYPGGPQISRLADSARTRINTDKEKLMNTNNENIRVYPSSNSCKSVFRLPRPMLHSGDYNFSFSGLKTAVLYLVKKLEEEMQKNDPRKSAISIRDNPRLQQEVAREFEDAVVEVLTKKTRTAIENNGIKSLVLGGGVASNKEIRKSFEKLAEEFDEIKLYIPKGNLSTDNSIMIAIAGYLDFSTQRQHDKNKILKAEGNLRLSK
ncbi:MAG: tRNA (adenosine(37)-N6)-threonylcarbamoyltransferase complex transferase subunit TsaD [Candidatus Paceibacterota bacterium]|jgi:N6-L-threonylcarbamoyladenine synthase